MCLSTLPNLTQLSVNLSSQGEALIILDNLPKLQYLNGKSTKDDTHLVDIEEKEIEEVSLNSELTYFYEVYKKISELIKVYVSEEKAKLFNEDFQKLLKDEIAVINKSVENTIPNYIYVSNVISSKIKIYMYFSEIIIDQILPNEKNPTQILETLKELNSRTKHNSDLSIELLHKLSPKISEKTSNLKSQLDFAIKGTNLVEEEMRNLLDKLEKQNRERNFLISQYEDEKTLMKEKISVLTQENKILTDKVIKKANAIVEEHKNFDNEFQENIGEVNSFTKINHKPNFSDSENKNLFNNSQVVITNRVLTIKMLLETINEIYASKEAYDKKCIENKMPRETMEQHMYSFLNQKYGLKSLIIEWATSIINGIKHYSSEDAEICLFGKILRNEIDEETRYIIQKLKASLSNVLKVRNYFKNKLVDDFNT